MQVSFQAGPSADNQRILKNVLVCRELQMSAPNAGSTTLNVDLREYAKKIPAPEDRPLFDEAVKAAMAGALRAAYVMIWLSCAESLKRRFREAQTRDHIAGKIVGEIENLEGQQRAVDRFLLDKARNYGFLSDTGHTLLEQVYEMRCIYGHPYEEAPSQEKVIDAAATTIELVLSQPVKLREGYGKQLLKSLLEERNFLDDQESSVSEFTQNLLRRIDERIYDWLLNEYWKELEALSEDPAMSIAFRRGVWFSRATLSQVGVDVLTDEQWHASSGRFPKTLMRVCKTAEIFGGIGELAQNSLIGSVLDESKIHASVLTLLERLNDVGTLSQRQQERFTEHVSDMKSSEIRASGLSTKTCYPKLIDAMKSSNWHIQNPAVSLVLSNGPLQTAQLTQEQQVNLGRNVLQAAEGRAMVAVAFLNKLSEDPDWPIDVARGVSLESFTNERNEIRPKDRFLGLVLSILAQLDKMERDALVAEIVESINTGILHSWVCRDDFTRTLERLRAYPWSEPIVSSLEAKVPAEEQEEV